MQKNLVRFIFLTVLAILPFGILAATHYKQTKINRSGVREIAPGLYVIGSEKDSMNIAIFDYAD